MRKVIMTAVLAVLVGTVSTHMPLTQGAGGAGTRVDAGAGMSSTAPAPGTSIGTAGAGATGTGSGGLSTGAGSIQGGANSSLNPSGNPATQSSPRYAAKRWDALALTRGQNNRSRSRTRRANSPSFFFRERIPILLQGNINAPRMVIFYQLQHSEQAMTDNARNVDRVWDMMKKIGFAMLVTRDGTKLRARPMSAYLERDENAIYFLTDARRHKDEEIKRDPGVNLSFADTSGQKYVSVTGSAEVTNDRARIKQLFSTPAKAWWENADDPNIRVLKITPDDAEIWDSPGTLVSYAKMAAAILTGTRPDVGDDQKVAM